MMHPEAEGTPYASGGVGNASSTASGKNLLDLEGLPVLEEATQTASRFLRVPICTVGVPDPTHLVLKAAVGLSQLGLMNPLAMTRRLPLNDSLVSDVWRHQRRLVVADTSLEEHFASSVLVQEYGIRACVGVPLLTTQGACLGVLVALDVQPRTFAENDIAFLELLARWCMSECERHDLAQAKPRSVFGGAQGGRAIAGDILLDTVRLSLMGQLTEEMRSPLTSITGMAGMLIREIYGPLTPKQREYAEIVRSSSQALLELVEEMVELNQIGSATQSLTPSSVDVEMLGQRTLNTLATLAKQHEQDLKLTIEPGSRLWVLDKTILRHLMYHLTFSVIQLVGEGGIVRIHVSQKNRQLNLAVWLSHPWLGEGLPASVLPLRRLLVEPIEHGGALAALLMAAQPSDSDESGEVVPAAESSAPVRREILSLLLSRQLAERHGGSLTLQGTMESGYRFVVVLPPLNLPTQSPIA